LELAQKKLLLGLPLCGLQLLLLLLLIGHTSGSGGRPT